MGQRGVTLVELLVVVALVGVLMGIFLGVTTRVRQAGWAMVCQAHQRQVALALAAYDLEQGHLPDSLVKRRFVIEGAETEPGFSGFDPPYDWWFMAVLERTRDRWNEEVLQCPAKGIRDTLFGPGNILCGNFGVNLALCRGTSLEAFYGDSRGRPRSLARLRQPGRTLLLADSGYAIVGWWHSLPSPPAPPAGETMLRLREARSYIPGLSANAQRSDLLEAVRDDAVRGRHLGRRVNVTFADGHVQRVAADDLAVEAVAGEGDQAVYRNLTPLWEPE